MKFQLYITQEGGHCGKNANVYIEILTNGVRNVINVQIHVSLAISLPLMTVLAVIIVGYDNITAPD